MSTSLPPLTVDLFSTQIGLHAVFHEQPSKPLATVVIVAYNTNWELIRCLDKLKAQSHQNFETILVDNGKNEAVLEKLKNYDLRYFRMKENYRPSLGRNVGITHAQGEIVIFLDDDALAGEDFVSQHLLAHQRPHTLGLRGKVLPKTNSSYNRLALMYDLGDRVVPSYIDLEGNASFPRSALMEVGGFNPDVFAGEGAELSYRLVKRFGGRENLLYWPEAVIYHDYASDLNKFLHKTLRGAKMQVYLNGMYPDFHDFIESYHPLPHGNIQKPANSNERVKLALLRRTGRVLKWAGLFWYGMNPPNHIIPP